jgi:hypothetical protein
MQHPDQDPLERLPQTEDSSERGYVRRSPRTQDPDTYEDLGTAETLDDDIGDIADEGHGHRG